MFILLFSLDIVSPAIFLIFLLTTLPSPLRVVRDERVFHPPQGQRNKKTKQHLSSSIKRRRRNRIICDPQKRDGIDPSSVKKKDRGQAAIASFMIQFQLFLFCRFLLNKEEEKKNLIGPSSPSAGQDVVSTTFARVYINSWPPCSHVLKA